MHTTNEVSGAHQLKVECTKDFLSKEERDHLFDTLCKHEAIFSGNSVNGKVKGTTSFVSIPDERLLGKADELVEVATSLSQRMLEFAPQLFEKLGITPRTLSELSITFIHGLSGHYGDAHADSTDGRYAISLVYYLHKTPKAYEGGQLNFYERNELNPKGHSNEPIKEVETVDNMLVAFPSQTYHGVGAVSSTSSDFADGRFAVVAFI